MVARTVKPAAASGFNVSIAQLWGGGPKWTITCGDCLRTFEKRIPMVSNPGVECPSCGAINVLPITVSRGD